MPSTLGIEGKLCRSISDFHMSFYRHFSYLEQIELAIHIHDLLPTVKLPLAFSVDEVFQGDPSFRFCSRSILGFQPFVSLLYPVSVVATWIVQF